MAKITEVDFSRAVVAFDILMLFSKYSVSFGSAASVCCEQL